MFFLKKSKKYYLNKAISINKGKYNNNNNSKV